MRSLSRGQLFATLWTRAYQAPPSTGFSRQEYWSGLPFPSPWDLPGPGIESGSPALQADPLTSDHQFRRCRRCGFDPWVGKISWRRKGQPTPVFLPGKSHGPGSLVGYSPCSCRVRQDFATEHTFIIKLHYIVKWRFYGRDS